jgi:hypothetical protein
MLVDPNIYVPVPTVQTWAYQVVYYHWVNGAWAYTATGPVVSGNVGFDGTTLTLGDSTSENELPESTLTVKVKGYYFPLVYYSEYTTAGWVNLGATSVAPRFLQYNTVNQGAVSPNCILYATRAG